MIRVGDRIDRFEVLARAGLGAMGAVHRARDTKDGSIVALKTLRLDVEGIEAPFDRFAHEVEVLSGIEDHSVVRYVAHGRVGDAPYLVMEWIEGESLADRLRASVPPTFGEVRALGSALARALAVCHARGVIHRDLKPQNVMLRASDLELPAIVDFGLARLSSGASLTVSGTRLGTPRFMAPEQIRDARRVDGRADVFSLGCVLFECAAGKPAFAGDEAMGVMVKILLERAPKVRDVCPTVPKALAGWIDAALEPNVDARPTAAELADGLDAIDLKDEGPLSAPYSIAITAAPSGSSDLETLEPVVFESNLPKTNGVFVGRARVLDRLDGLLAAPGATVSLWGPPGIGKSRLALESLSRRGQGLHCDLRELRTRGEVVRVIGRALRLELGADPERAVARALGTLERVVLLLDGVDHLLPELRGLIDVLRVGAPGLRVILTSRERLELDIERLEVGPLTREEGAQLFRARAGVDGAAVDEIVQAVSCIPLAIELAAGRADVLGLEGLRTSDGDLAVAMRDAIAASYAQLDDDARRALCVAAVFPSSFGVGAARALLGDRAEDLLSALRAKSLLSSESTESDVRLSMLAPIRAFALSQLGAEARREALDRHAAFHVSLADRLASEIERSGSLSAQRRLMEEQRHLQLALEHLLAAERFDDDTAVALALGLESPLAARGATDQLVTFLERVLARAEGPVPRLHRLRARALTSRGRARDALPVLIDAISRAKGDPALGGLTLERGVLHHALGELDDARACYTEAIELLAEQGHERDEARALGNLGALLHDSGEFDAAVSHYREAIGLLRAVGDLRLHGIFLGNLALLEQELGARGEARRHYDEAVSELEAYRDPRLLGVTLGNLAALDLEEGDLSRARQRLERAHGLLLQTGDARSQSLCLARLGAVLARAGELEDAESRFARAERLSRRDPVTLKVVHLLRAFVDFGRGRRDLAIIRMANAEKDAAGSDDLRTVLRTLRALL